MNKAISAVTPDEKRLIRSDEIAYRGGKLSILKCPERINPQAVFQAGNQYGDVE
jgi:hypothetical protein